MKNPQKGLIVPVLLIFIAILLIGGGVYTYIHAKQSRQNNKLDTEIKVYLSWARTAAELYFIDNKNSYTKVCNDSTIEPTPGNFVDQKRKLEEVSNSVICKDSPTAWAMSAQLKSNPSQYGCSDNTSAVITSGNPGAFVITNSAIITTNCP